MSYSLYVLASACGGLLVGLLGTGSSLIVLPSLILIFGGTLPGVDPLRLAAGTTMASMAVGAVAGAIAQYRAGQVDQQLFRMMLLPYIVGSLAGPWISRLFPAKVLAVYVSGIILAIALRMLFGRRANDGHVRDYREHRIEVSAVLVSIGLGSSIAGIASGIFAIPYLSRFSVPIRSVVGTSTASAAVYSACGTVGYVVAGWSSPGLPRGHFGYVYLPAFAIMAITAAVATPFGVHLARFIDEKALKRLFAVFLMLASVAILVT